MGKKLNKVAYGALLGAILPVILFLILHYSLYDTYSFKVIKYNFEQDSLNYFMRISVLVNIVPIVLGNQLKLTKFAAGAFVVTILYAIPVMIIAFT